MSRTESIKRMNKRSGLTLIELAVATLLSAILMVLIGGVLRSVAHQRVWALQQGARAPATSVLADQLERDLANARNLTAGRNSLRLQGLLAEDPATHLPLQRPAEVVYSIETLAGEPCLVRTIVQTGGGRARRAARMVLWIGAVRIETEQLRLPAVLPAAQADGETSESRSPRAADPNQMPARAEVVVYDRGGNVLCRVDVING